MAMSKRVKTAGSLYKGSKIVISSTPGPYILDISFTSGTALNGVTIVPDTYGTGDYWGMQRLNALGEIADSNGKANITKGVLAETIYNIGAGAGMYLDFACLELFESGGKLRLTYENVAGKALVVYVILETIR